MSDEPREVYGGADSCLHCLVWDVINKHAPANPHVPGTVLYEPERIIGNLVDVMAEVIAGIPDLRARKQFIKQAGERLRAQTARRVVSGDHPGVQTMRKQ